MPMKRFVHQPEPILETIQVQDLSPMMRQWYDCKEKSKETLLLFRMGDFFEAFYSDASLLAQELDLTLTQRGGIPMAGIPYHQLDLYLDRLIKKGYPVSIADQMEEAAHKKNALVRRQIVRTVSPGTLVQSSVLEERKANYIATVADNGERWSFAFADITSTSVHVVECATKEELEDEWRKQAPAEVLTQNPWNSPPKETTLILGSSSQFDFFHCTQMVTRHFNLPSLDSMEWKYPALTTQSVGALLHLIHSRLGKAPQHLQRIIAHRKRDALAINATSREHLELFTPSSPKGPTLLSLLDHTKTAMGSRCLQHWMARPLVDIELIQQRHDGVEECVHQPLLLNHWRHLLAGIRDLERLTMRIASQFITPKDCGALLHSCRKISSLTDHLHTLRSPLFCIEEEWKATNQKVISLLEQSLNDSLPHKPQDGSVFKKGFNSELDELRALIHDGDTWIDQYQEELRSRFGIKQIRVKFNRAIGYYIETTKQHASKLEPHLQKRQSLTQYERFGSQELSAYETKRLTAEAQLTRLEVQLFEELRDSLLPFASDLFSLAERIAQMDALFSLAHVAIQNRYTRPLITLRKELAIEEGRHPIVESIHATPFIPNDCTLDHEDHSLMILTGPNMGGKSTYMRQTALIVIMAQMGSFVPASKVRMGVVGQIFTRIGASDDLSQGRSTFMVEMSETAYILQNASERSLILLDELGRGTNTEEGVAIAHAVITELVTMFEEGPFVLFATHFPQLIKLEQLHRGIANFHVDAHIGQSLTFLHRISPGGSTKSYGIEVAQFAGIPRHVIECAKELHQQSSTEEIHS